MRLLPANTLETDEGRAKGRQRELPTCPLSQAQVQSPPRPVHHRGAVECVITQQAPYHRGEPARDLRKRQALPSVNPKRAKRRIDPLLALAADPCAEDPQPHAFAVMHHVTRSEGEAKKVKRPVTPLVPHGRTGAFPAIDNFCLRLAQFKRERLQTLADLLQQTLRLLTTGHVHDNVVGVPLELHLRYSRLHPLVESFVQIQVRKHRADHAALRRAAITGDKRSILLHHRGAQPALTVKQDVPLVQVLTQHGQQLLMVDRVKERSDIQIDHKPMLAAAAVTPPQGIVGAATRAVTVGIRVKLALHHRFQFRSYHLLRHAVEDRRDAQRPLFAITLGNALLAHRRWHVAPAGQTVPKGVQVTARVRLDGIHGQTIDTSGFTSPANVFPRFPYLSLFYRLTLCSLKGGHPAAALRRSELSRLCSLFRGPLRSSTITVPSTLLRVHLPPPFRSFSRPRGGSTCAFRSYRKRWLLLFRDKASWRVLPPLCRIRCGQLFQFGNPRTGPRDLTATRVFESQPSFDTSSAVHFRSAPSRTPEAFSASFPSPFSTSILRFKHRRAV